MRSADGGRTARNAGSRAAGDLDSFTRGVVIEHRLAARDYANWGHMGVQHGGHFPLIDFAQGTAVVSVKTVDRRNMSAAIPELQDHIEHLANRGITIGGVPATSRALDIRVRAGKGAELASLQEFGDALGVRVTINTWP